MPKEPKATKKQPETNNLAERTGRLNSPNYTFLGKAEILCFGGARDKNSDFIQIQYGG